MGRRRSRRKPPPKKSMLGLETQFTCPFCNHEKSCDVKMDRTRNVGIINCRICLEDFQTSITYKMRPRRGVKSSPVDVAKQFVTKKIDMPGFKVENIPPKEVAAEEDDDSNPIDQPDVSEETMENVPENVQKDLSEPVDVYSDWVDACEAANA